MHTRDNRVTPEFAQLMVNLAAAYPTTGKLTEAAIRVYARALADITLPDLKVACGRAVRESKIFPTVAELRQFVSGSVDDAAVLAWAAFRTAAADVGAYASLEVEDGCAAAALEAVFGSWSAYCAVDAGPELNVRRQEFLAAYRQARRLAPAGPPARLAGLCETNGSAPPPGTPLAAGRLLADGTVQSLRGGAVQQKALPEQVRE